MNAKEILKKVKALFDAPVIIPTVEPVITTTLATYKLKDGTEISISGETIEIGAMVTIAGAPAAEGEYELEDGRKITVDATGAVTLVVTPEPVTQPDFVAPPTIEERIKAIEDKLSNLPAPAVPTGLATEVQLQAAEQKITKQDEVIKGLFELAEKLVEEPTAEPKAMSESQKEKFAKVSAKDQRLKALQESFTNRKTQFQQNN